MTEVEKWLDHYKSNHTWEDTVKKILKLYEYSPMSERIYPYVAFCNSLKKTHGVSEGNSWSPEVKKSSVNLFQRRIMSLYGSALSDILVKDTDGTYVVACTLIQELLSKAEIPCSQQDIYAYCNQAISDGNEKKVLYYLAGITMCATTSYSTMHSSILSSIAYRLVYSCGEYVYSPESLPIKPEEFSSPDDYAIFGKKLFEQ